MKPARPPGRGRAISLFAQVLVMLLVVVAVVQVANAVMLLTIPPPRPEVFHLDEIVQVLKGDRSAQAMAGLKVETRARPPRSSPPGEADRGRTGPGFDHLVVQALAERLGVPASHVRLETYRPLRLFGFSRPIQLERRLRRGEPPGPGGGFVSSLSVGGGVVVREEVGGRGAMAGDGPGPSLSMAGELPRHDQPFGPGGPRSFSPPVIAPFKIGLLQADGRWLVVENRQALLSPWRLRILLWLAVSASLCLPLAYVYARWLAAPIRRFAEAADRLGRDPTASEVEIAGPAEVRLAGEAFKLMQERLQRYIDNRTTIVAAVAHDLRTPLSRMRFLLETPGKDLRARLSREIDEMDAMVAATLAFVRDASSRAARAELDLPSLLESLADDVGEEGFDVQIGVLAPAVVRGDPMGLKRLFDNLIRNGVKFAGHVTLNLWVEGDEAVVDVADDGPGLPPCDLERAFEPFYRGEVSRNRETGGAGLGLAVVRSIARAHGGDALLMNRPEGGLVCRVRLPLSEERLAV